MSQKEKVEQLVAQAREAGVPLEQSGKARYVVTLRRSAVVYLPKFGRWEYRGRKHEGDAQAFGEWYRAQAHAEEQHDEA